MKKPTPPALRGLPVLGNLLDFKKSSARLIQRGYDELGSVFTLKLGPKKVAVLIGPEHHKAFFLETDNALRMDKAYRFLRAMFGNVSFAASPDVYQAQRHIQLAPFKRQRLSAYVDVMVEEVQTWLDGLGDTGEIEILEEMLHLTQHVAAHTLLGKQFREQVGVNFWKAYADLAQSIDPILPPNWPMPKNFRRERAKRQLRKILFPFIKERRQSIEQHDDFLQEFIDARYKDGRPLESEAILNLILGLVFAGHETTAGQAAWTVIELLKHPGYQILVQNEIDQEVPDAMFDLNVLGQMNLTKWAVDETTRLHPVANLMMRHVEEDFDVGDYRIPAGWMVMVSPELAHKLESSFQRPDQYNPLRFAPGREEHKQDFWAMIPFGGGVHKCTGMNFAINEMMIVLAMLFRQFELELVTPETTPRYDLGAMKPSPTIIRYRRRTSPAKRAADVHAQTRVSGCPHLARHQTMMNGLPGLDIQMN